MNNFSHAKKRKIKIFDWYMLRNVANEFVILSQWHVE